MKLQYLLSALTIAAWNVTLFGATNLVPATNAAVSTNVGATTAARTAARHTSGGDYLGMIAWIVVIGAIFGFMWHKGYLVSIRNYVAETREELRKCSWPTTAELKSSTVVVFVTMVLLGVFTVSVDWVLSMVMRLITA